MKNKIAFFALFIFLLSNNILTAQSINTDFSEVINLINKVQYLDNETAEAYDVDVLCPPNVRINIDADKKNVSNINLGSVSCTDKYTITNISNNAYETFELGNTVVTWELKTKNGVELRCNQTVRVNDIEAPVVLCPVNVRIKLKPEQNNVSDINLGKIEYSDNFGIKSVTNDAPKHFPVGNTIVTWTVKDFSGNITECNQAIRVKN